MPNPSIDTDILEPADQEQSISPDQHRYRMTLLPPAKVRELSKLRPSRVIFDTLRCWGFIIGSWTVCALWPEPWIIAVAIVVIGIHASSLYILAHDSFHRRLFNSSEMNDRFANAFLLAPIGASVRMGKLNHLEHHRLLSTDLDPDRWKYSCFGKAGIGPFVLYLSGLKSIFISAWKILYKIPKQKQMASRTEGKTAGPELRETRRDWVWLVVCQSILIGGLTWAMKAWWAYPLLWLFPWFSFAFLADNLRSFCEHSQPYSDDKADQHRLITYISNPVEKLFVAPLNMNYHAVHHLWPSIPYYNLPQADRAIRKMTASEGLEWRTSYFGYMIRYLLALPLKECQRDTGGRAEKAKTA